MATYQSGSRTLETVKVSRHVFVVTEAGREIGCLSRYNGSCRWTVQVGVGRGSEILRGTFEHFTLALQVLLNRSPANV